jgi:predicted metal-dependent hydrolase
MKKTVTSIEIEIAGHKVLCDVRRSKRAMNVRIRISQHGLFELVLPERGSFEEARKFLESKKDFLEKHLNLIVQKEESPYMLFGKEIKVIHNYNLFLRNHSLHFDNDTQELSIESPQGSKVTTLELYKAYINIAAPKYLVPRAQLFAQTHGFKPSVIRVRKMRSKWGCCSSKKEISLSPMLLTVDTELSDYVIIHELCHLKQLNHSKLFYSELEKLLPNFRELRNRLLKKAVT